MLFGAFRQDVKDVHIFGTMTMGPLLIGIGFVLIYPQIEKTVTADDCLQRLPIVT